MNRQQLVSLIQHKKSMLCVGLDSDITKIPSQLLSHEDPVFEFNKAIIDATLPYTIAYKPNLAFYESRGLAGWISLKKTMDYLESFRDEIFTIADAKRGDIGNTSQQYARAFFDKQSSCFDFDAITVSPYMGIDSVSPFMEFGGKWVILLTLTSNKGAVDFQHLQIEGSKERLFEIIIKKSLQWGSSPSNMMYVVGATQASLILEIRKMVPDHFLLVPGIGAQGGSLEEVLKYGLNRDGGLLINASRSVIFANQGNDFSTRAAEAAHTLQQQIAAFL
jgi:orotidine-5'-phosphate decarboxylase